MSWFAAEASAPLRTRSQKVSPGAWWVMSATVARGGWPLAALGVVVVAARSPPEQAATATNSTERMYANDIRAIDPPSHASRRDHAVPRRVTSPYLQVTGHVMAGLLRTRNLFLRRPNPRILGVPPAFA